MIWPWIVVGMLLVILSRVVLYAADCDMRGLFPAPNKVESKSERIAREQREERDRQQAESRRIRMRQGEINRMERENGLPVTDWTQHDTRT